MKHINITQYTTYIRKMSKTTRRINIAIDSDIKDELDQIGRINQTYSDVIRELLRAYQVQQSQKQKKLEVAAR